MEQLFKPSRFNYSFSHRNGSLLFNGASRALIFVPEATFLNVQQRIFSQAVTALENFENDPVIGSTIACLVSGRFLVPAETDEVAALKARNQLFREIYPLQVTIAPTMDCNLGCYYCFEEKYASYMDQSICDSVVDYIRLKAQQLSTDRLALTWFGGEPMLNPDAIEHISARLIDFCDDGKIPYFVSMISNGTQWPEKPSDAIAFVKRIRLRSVQFTFDGLEANHNKRRRYVAKSSGLSSFEALSRTVSALVGNVTIHLRINCDPGNIGDVYGLIDYFVQKNWLYPGSKVYPYLAPIRPASETCDFVRKHQVDHHEFNRVHNEVRRYIAQFVDPVEYASLIMPKPVKILCSAVAPNSVIIGPDGSLYKCTADVGAHEKSHGTIWADLSGSQISPFRILSGKQLPGSNVNEYGKFDVFSQATCPNCKYLPLCMSGCPKQQLETYRPGGNRHNIDEFKRYWDDSLESMVKLYADFVLDAGRPKSPLGSFSASASSSTLCN